MCRACRRAGTREDVVGEDQVHSRVCRNRSGQGLAEYSLILAFIALIAMIALIFLGDAISTLLSSMGTSV